MDVGLYKLKDPARRTIRALLPLFKNVSPDVISWSIVPVGIATAAAYFWADAFPLLLLAGSGLILLRMFLATLDGFVAQTFNRSSPIGEIVNRLPPEIADALLLLTLTLSSEARHIPGAATLAVAWLTTFSGLIGMTISRPIQSVGPVGSTDRLAALIAFSIAGYLAPLIGHPFDALKWFLIWCAAGGCLTILLRLHRAMRRPRR